MGGTLTLLVRQVVGRDVDAAGWRIGTLYAVNTAGAALGCLATDLVLVPVQLPRRGARAVFEDVVVMAPDNASARAKLGEAYLGLGRSADARVQFERALRLSPALADARAGLERARTAPPPG